MTKTSASVPYQTIGDSMGRKKGPEKKKTSPPARRFFWLPAMSCLGKQYPKAWPCEGSNLHPWVTQCKLSHPKLFFPPTSQIKECRKVRLSTWIAGLHSEVAAHAYDHLTPAAHQAQAKSLKVRWITTSL